LNFAYAITLGMKLSELARETGASADERFYDLEIEGAAGLDEAGAAQVTFLSNPRYTPRLQTTRAAAVYVAEGVEVGRGDLAVLRARDPYLAYTRALRLFNPEPEFEPSVHPSAVVEPSARLGAGVAIGPCSYVGRDVVIGDRVLIHANVTVYEGVEIGDDTVIHSGAALREGTIVGARVRVHNNAVLGSDGFGYAKDEEGRWLKIPQTGRVRVKDDVEIGACSTVDRASVGETVIARGAKVDNLVQVGHSCTVGEDTLLCAQVGLAGSSHVGSRVILAGQVGVAGHLRVGDGAVITAKSATSHDVPGGRVISGIPAFDNREWLRSTAAFRRLGDMQRTLRSLEQRIASLEKDSRPDVQETEPSA
jgi:UDP-3-O-[3-hydroxymyristoyl] glucosamine N-acyltransferase